MKDRTALVTPILLAACLIITVNFAIRGAFGVFQIPIAEEFGWPRAEFSMAIAIQNLFWGIGQPIFGAIAEKIGDRKAIFFGAVLYAAGLVLSAFATTPFAIQSLEVLVGLGIAGTGFGVILAIVARSASDEHRSMALAMTTAAGSLGQVFGAPLAEWMLSFLPWQTVFLVFAAAILGVLFALPFMRAPVLSKTEIEESMGTVLSRAFRDPSYAMIFMGFFSCGYQLGFIVAHFPALVTEMCGPILPGSTLHALGVTTTSALGAVAISVIGLANIVGTLMAGWLGQRYPKKYLLASIYAARTIIGAVFILSPITPMSVILFSVFMGSLWLATVPLTSGLVGYLFGLRYMGTLYGFVFLSHQLGSFLGIWLGGRLYDATGDYTLVWWLGLAVGAFSALVHLPIREEKRGLPQAA
ncbi:MFS transporter [Silicimonas sp. MF1-12-2]|uniref:MFS transporter n=1 Tax=Silicimonas sp. MF1-12-2 TaxID=3384793 RepID=UPI0039B4377B